MATPQWLRWASAAAFLGFAALGDTLVHGLAHAEPRPAVVELFTSEGCNSCPPAEAYVGELAGRTDVLALAFHVDYWDDLGWRDRFGLGQSVERQRSYARSLRLSSVYTPEIVIDGRADYDGSNRVGIGSALKEKREGVPVILSVGNGDADVRLEAPSGEAPGKKEVGGDVVLVAYLRKAVTAIGRGENAGRTLDEY